METKRKHFRLLAFPFSLLATYAAYGQPVTPQSAAAEPAGATPLWLEKTPEPSRNRFQLGYRMGLNITASFKNIGAFPAQSNPDASPNPAHPGYTIRTYDDGFLGEDSTHDMHGSYQGTWNWGYQNASQVQGDTMVMHSSSSPGASSNDQGDTIQSGFELTYSRELYRGEKWRWGLEAAFGYTPVNIKDSSPLTTVYNRITDVYQLNGVIPPTTLPYSGSFGGAGPVIGDTPTRTEVPTPVSITGSRSFDANLFGFRFGPYLEFPLGKNVTFDLNGGLAVVFVTSDFSYNEMVTTPDSGTIHVAGSSSSSGTQVGGYVGGQISVALGKGWGTFAGAQFQDVGTYTQRSQGQSAVLDLSKSVFVSVGISYSF
jgi:hypothetical protein